MWRQLVALSVILCVSVCVRGAPHRTSYDQRQQGEMNIHAQLDNIVVVFIPTSNIQMMDLGLKNKYHQEKPQGFLQFLQKFKDDMATVNNEISPVVTSSQEVVLNHNVGESNEEKEEEVVATVEEMKPSSTEKITTETQKEETTEGTSNSDQPTLSESVQESVLVISVPEQLKDAVKAAEDEVKSSLPDKKSDKQFDKVDLTVKEPEPAMVVPVKEESNMDKIVKDVPRKELILEALPKPAADKVKDANPSEDKVKKGSEEISKPPRKEIIVQAVLQEVPKKRPEAVNESKEKKLEDPKKKVEEPPKKSSSEEEPKKKVGEEPKKKVDEPVKKLGEESAAEDSVTKKEISRREKVIKYKPETKWAPGLVDLMGPVVQKSRDPQVQRLTALCHPGVWDVELKTCLMPGDRRSRSEIAKFLEAFRFGIAAPTSETIDTRNR